MAEPRVRRRAAESSFNPSKRRSGTRSRPQRPMTRASARRGRGSSVSTVAQPAVTETRRATRSSNRREDSQPLHTGHSHGAQAEPAQGSEISHGFMGVNFLMPWQVCQLLLTLEREDFCDTSSESN
jgi:hypothetical protein